MKSVAILGPGAVGGLLAALFWKHKIEVRCIARAETVEAITKNGLTIRSNTFGDFTAWPATAEHIAAPADIIFITVKANVVNDAVERIDSARAAHSLIIPLLNGLGHMRILKARYGRNVALGTIGALEVFEESPGVINHTSGPGKIELASDEAEMRARLPAVAELIRRIGFEANVFERETEVVWRKLVRLNAIACVTAATHSPIGMLRSDPGWRAKIQGAVHEATLVAAKEGVIISPQEVMAQIDGIPGEQLSSLARDVARGEASELDAIPGAILERCGRYGISCPTINELYHLIKARR